jgi:hypothetical protein
MLTNEEIEKTTTEELYFSYWLDELKDAGLIVSYTYQPPPWTLTIDRRINVINQLKRSAKLIERQLLKPWTYGADFRITFYKEINTKIQNVFQDILCITLPMPYFITHSNYCYVEIKPVARNPRQAMSDNKFPLNQKAVFDKWQTYVNKCIPDKLFAKTFTPKKVILEEVYKVNCKGGKVGESKLKYKVRTFDEFKT